MLRAMLPLQGPLPPLLAALHARLEEHVEAIEEGVLIIEQDRCLVPGGGPPQLPVVVFVPARPREGSSTGRVAPELIAEVTGPRTNDDRLQKYAAAGVREYWRVDGAGPTIAIHEEPDAATRRFARVRTYGPQEPIASTLFPKLVLRPGDLASG